MNRVIPGPVWTCRSQNIIHCQTQFVEGVKGYWMEHRTDVWDKIWNEKWDMEYVP